MFKCLNCDVTMNNMDYLCCTLNIGSLPVLNVRNNVLCMYIFVDSFAAADDDDDSTCECPIYLFYVIKLFELTSIFWFLLCFSSVQFDNIYALNWS